MTSQTYVIQAPPSVFRSLDALSDPDYDLVAAAILAIANDPYPPGSIKLRMPKARLTLFDGTLVSGPSWRIRCRSSSGGKSGGFRIIYLVDQSGRRICIAKVARRDDDTYDALERLLRGSRLSSLTTP